jgi:hypothetical protein
MNTWTCGSIVIYMMYITFLTVLIMCTTSIVFIIGYQWTWILYYLEVPETSIMYYLEVPTSYILGTSNVEMWDYRILNIWLPVTCTTTDMGLNINMYNRNLNPHFGRFWVNYIYDDFIFGVLTPLSAIFQLYHGDHF